MRHIAKWGAVVACFSILVGALLFLWQSRQIPESVLALKEVQQLDWMRQRHQASIAALWVAVVAFAGLLWSAVLLALVFVRNKAQRIYAKDGLFPVILESTGTLIDDLTGATQKTTHNPNLLAAAAGTVRVERGGATSLSMGQNGFNHDQLLVMHNGQQRVQQTQAGHGRQPRAAGRWEVLERNGLLPKPKEDAIEAEAIEAAPVAMLGLKDSIIQSSADKFILGQADNGALCTVNPRAVVHFGILGSTGCGKTASTGFHLAMAAMRSGYRVVVLDGKGGMDWSVFADVAEVHDTDRSTFLDQMEVVSMEYLRRMELARRYQVKHVAMLNSADVPPMLIIVEEFGDLARSLGNKRMGQIDNMLDSIGAKGRAADVHFCLIDQYPERWSQTVLGATKAKILYKLGPGQGVKAGDWHAQTLPDYGRFRYNGVEYNAWHVEPVAQQLLTTGQRAGVFGSFPALIEQRTPTEHPTEQPTQERNEVFGTVRSVIEGEGAAVARDTPTATNEQIEQMTEIQIRAAEYLRSNPGAGVRTMARDLGISPSYAHQLKQELSQCPSLSAQSTTHH